MGTCEGSYDRIRFNQKDRDTWPLTDQIVLACNGHRYEILKIDSEGEWFNQDDIWVNSLVFRPVWWSYLPIMSLLYTKEGGKVDIKR